MKNEGLINFNALWDTEIAGHVITFANSRKSPGSIQMTNLYPSVKAIYCHKVHAVIKIEKI